MEPFPAGKSVGRCAGGWTCMVDWAANVGRLCGACGTSLRFAGLALAAAYSVLSDVSRETIGGCRAGTWWLSDSTKQQLLRQGPGAEESCR